MTHLNCLWQCWMLGIMSKCISPCNTWHQLFGLPSYCCWHKVMPPAHDPRWHQMMSWDVQAFWAEWVGRTESTPVSLQLRCSDSLSFLWNYAFWWPISQKWTQLGYFFTIQWSCRKISRSEYNIYLQDLTHNIFHQRSAYQVQLYTRPLSNVQYSTVALSIGVLFGGVYMGNNLN